jgi:hypothetical protein
VETSLLVRIILVLKDAGGKSGVGVASDDRVSGGIKGDSADTDQAGESPITIKLEIRR